MAEHTIQKQVMKKTNPLCERIKKSRNIKDASCKTYMSALNKLRNTIEDKPDGEIKNTDFLKDFDKVMKAINSEKKITSQKNKLTAVLVALTSDEKPDKELIDKFGSKLKKLGETYLAFLKTQTKTETQANNWLEYNDLIKIVNKVMREVRLAGIQKKEKDKLTNKEFDLLQQYITLRTYIAFPLRNDFADMKVMKEDEFKKLSEAVQQKHNYLVLLRGSKQFHINQFKNSRFLGSKVLVAPKPLSGLIDLWLKHNKSGYYLVKTDRKRPMGPNTITKFLNKIFIKHAGKKISSSMIRHIVISHTLKGEKTIKQKEDADKAIENKFFHNATTNQLYRKVDILAKPTTPSKD